MSEIYEYPDEYDNEDDSWNPPPPIKPPCSGWKALNYMLGGVVEDKAMMKSRHEKLKAEIGPVKYERLIQHCCMMCGLHKCLCYEEEMFQYKKLFQKTRGMLEHVSIGWKEEINSMREIRLKLQDEGSLENINSSRKIWNAYEKISKPLNYDGTKIIVKLSTFWYIYMIKILRGKTSGYSPK